MIKVLFVSLIFCSQLASAEPSCQFTTITPDGEESKYILVGDKVGPIKIKQSKWKCFLSKDVGFEHVSGGKKTYAYELNCGRGDTDFVNSLVAADDMPNSSLLRLSEGLKNIRIRFWCD